MSDWTPPKNDALFQFECQIIQDILIKMICHHCLEQEMPNGLTKGMYAVYCIYQGIKGIVPPELAIEEMRKVFDLDDAGVVTLATQVDKFIIPQMKAIESAPEKNFLNDSIRSCFNGQSWN